MSQFVRIAILWVNLIKNYLVITYYFLIKPSLKGYRMSLITLLQNSLNNYDDTDPLWYQFILDHKTYLIQNSSIRFITTAYLQTYTNNLKGYLQSISYPVNCAWIVGLINNIPNDVAFDTTISQLYIPPYSLIQTLYTNYITTQNASWKIYKWDLQWRSHLWIYGKGVTSRMACWIRYNTQR